MADINRVRASSFVAGATSADEKSDIHSEKESESGLNR
jgi:hypothetical protein